MSMRSYGVYYQGAMFSEEDFDSVKVVIKCAEDCGTNLSPEEKQLIRTNTVDRDLVKKLCDALGIHPVEGDEINDYKFFSDELIKDISEWFEDCDCSDSQPVLGTEDINVYIVSEIEGDFIYDNLDREDEYVTDCFIFAFYTPFAWKHESDHFPKNIDEAVAMLRKAGEKLLKDDIDWAKRLGELVGSAFG